jgi:hypothetical protein
LARSHGTENPPNESRREDAYRLFLIRFLGGVFQENGRSWVVWVNPEFPFRRLTVKDAEQFLADHRGNLAGLILQCFQWCLLPHRVARAWFEAEAWDLAPWLKGPATSGHSDPLDVHEISSDATPTDITPAAGSANQVAAPYKSGAQGRPTSINLIRVDLERRREEGQVLPTLKAESEALTARLAEEHPDAPPATAKTIRNSREIQILLHEAVRAAKMREERPK